MKKRKLSARRSRRKRKSAFAVKLKTRSPRCVLSLKLRGSANLRRRRDCKLKRMQKLYVRSSRPLKRTSEDALPRKKKKPSVWLLKTLRGDSVLMRRLKESASRERKRIRLPRNRLSVNVRPDLSVKKLSASDKDRRMTRNVPDLRMRSDLDVRSLPPRMRSVVLRWSVRWKSREQRSLLNKRLSASRWLKPKRRDFQSLRLIRLLMRPSSRLKLMNLPPCRLRERKRMLIV